MTKYMLEDSTRAMVLEPSDREAESLLLTKDTVRSLRPDQLVVHENYWLCSYSNTLASLDYLGTLDQLLYGGFSSNGEQHDLGYEDGVWHVVGLEDDVVAVIHVDPLMHAYLTQKEVA